MFERGFRPFFGLAALLAALAVPAWVWLLGHGAPHPLALPARDWHVHEMLFGYGLAAVAGFLLTALPGWTHRPAVAGPRLAVLAALWLAGRIALAWPGPAPEVSIAVAMAFPLALAALVWREVLAAGNRRNLVVCVLVTLFAGADAAMLLGEPAGGHGERAGIASLVLLITLIGGRVVPAFSRNWMKARGMRRLPAPFGGLDAAALGAGALALAAFVVMPREPVTGWLLAAAAVAHAVRLLRWRGWCSAREPLVLILHLGYAWIVIGLALSALSILGGAVPPASAVHALTAGAVGTMTLAIMTRATLGHTGRALHAGGATVLLYAMVIAGAALRVSAPWLPVPYTTALWAAAGLWSGAFAVFLAVYAPMLVRGSGDGAA